MSLKETFLVSPLSVPGCQLWLDAADSSTLSLSGTNVTHWRDKSGNGRNTTLITGTVSYSNSGLSISTSDSYLTGSLGASDYTGSILSCFCVASMNSASGAVGRILSLGKVGTQDWDNLSSFMAFGRGVGLILRTYRNNQTVVSPPSIPAYSTPFLASSGQSSSTMFISVNGGTQSTQAISGSFAINAYRIGADLLFEDPSEQFNGVINEVILYFSQLTTSERQKIEGYLAWKWGLTASLPSTHPFKTYRPVNGLSVPIPLSYTNPKRISNLTPFDPRSISGCQMWLDAADSSTLTFSGSKISSWRDKTQNTNVVQSTSSFQPTYLATSFNNLPTLQFVGVQGSSYQYLQSSSTSIYNSVSAMRVFAVMRVVSTPPSFPSPFSIQNKVSFYLRGLNNSSGFFGNNIWTYQGSTFVANADTVFPYDTNTLSCLSLGATQQFFLNGADTIASPSFTFGSGTNGNIIIGWSGYNTNDGFNGYISEILVYTSSLSKAQQQQIEGYLAWKWGLTSSLPNNHPYKIPLAPFPTPLIPRKLTVNRFSPLTISALQLWLDAADTSTISLSGSNVTQWRDKSGNSRNASKTTATTNPLYVPQSLNKLPVVANTGSSGLSGTFAVNTLTNMSIFVVCNDTSAAEFANNTGGYVLWWNETGSWGQIQMYISQSRLDWRFGTGQAENKPTFNLASNVGTSYNIVNISKRSRSEVGYLNGVTVGTYTAANAAIANTSSTFVITGPASGSSYATNNIAEILIYTSDLSSNQRQQIEGYLAWKWGLQGNLPSTHPFKLFPPSP